MSWSESHVPHQMDVTVGLVQSSYDDYHGQVETVSVLMIYGFLIYSDCDRSLSQLRLTLMGQHDSSIMPLLLS